MSSNNNNINKNNKFKHTVEFLGPNDDLDPTTPYVSYNFNVIFTDTLLMYHICHLYHNCIQLIDEGEIKESEIDDYITLHYVVLSVQEALDNRIKCLSASYIDDNYKWCYDRPDIFDICLGYFSKIKKELSDLFESAKLKSKLLENGNVNCSETFDTDKDCDCNK